MKLRQACAKMEKKEGAHMRALIKMLAAAVVLANGVRRHGQNNH
jgi:hypothetical protein